MISTHQGAWASGAEQRYLFACVGVREFVVRT